MSLVNRRAVKAFVAEFERQVAESFLLALDNEVRLIIRKSIYAANNHKRVIDLDLYAWKKMKNISEEVVR